MQHQILARTNGPGGEAHAAAAPVHDVFLADPNHIGRHWEWGVDFRQIDPGPMQTRVVMRSGPRLRLLELHLDRGVHQQGCSPADTVTFGLPVTPSLRSWRGAAIDTPGLVNFGTGSEFECVSGPGFVGLTVSIDTPLLARVADQLGLPRPDEIPCGTMLPVRRRTRALQRLGEDGRALLHTPGAPFDDRQQEDLVAGLISAAADAETFDDRSEASLREKSVTRAIDLMRGRLDEGVSIGRICADSGASWRTLTRGFRERFGIGPKAYFNRLRLCRVRSALLQGWADTSVADAANAWGFWHMGQFARDYRRMFGELPSDTLKGARSN
jgi:AraC-like DNA-binding protein